MSKDICGEASGVDLPEPDLELIRRLAGRHVFTRKGKVAALAGSIRDCSEGI